eukprot:NODE_280_length_11906_cov_0.405268.p7 type:complete len:314 gc:universal NODE_280_length_11906_cov_0.405268:658-1599(+)
MSTDEVIIAYNTELEALRRKQKKKKELSLCSQNIQIITAELQSFTKLSSLYLCCNSITLFPESILKLKHLVFLSLKVNEIKQLPDLTALAKLKDLDISYNSIRAIKGLPAALKKLDLSNNSIAKLPQSIGNLVKLHTLNVSNNPLINLPSTIHNCRYLAKLITANCLFIEKPSTNVLPSLKELAARSMINSNQSPSNVRIGSHEEKIPKMGPLKRLSIYRINPRKINSNMKTRREDSLLSLNSLTLNGNHIPKNLNVYFNSLNNCACCGTPVWNSSTRYSILRRDMDIPLEHLLCSSHWNTHEERIISFFESQ